MGIKAVLFDMDGVLVDTEKIILKSAKKALNEWGIYPKDEDFLEFVGKGEIKFVGGVAQKYGVPFETRMKERTYEIYGDIVKDEIYLYDGVLELIDYLKTTGMKFAICSSADFIKIKYNMEAVRIDLNSFAAVVSANDVKRTKPFPDLFLKGAELIAEKPCECVVIEDSIGGIKAAKSAGMANIAVASTFTGEELKNKALPDYIAANIPEVMSIIKKIMNYNNCLILEK